MPSDRGYELFWRESSVHGWNEERKNSRKICLPALSSRTKSLELLSDRRPLQTASGSELMSPSQLLGLTPPWRSSGIGEH